MGIENKIVVLCLDAVYRDIEYKSVADAFVSMNSCGKDGKASWLALEISYAVGEDGKIDTNNCTSFKLVEWSEWIKLPIRDFDLSIKTIRGSIRIPSIIVSRKFAKTIMREPKLTKDNIFRRDDFTCQYTGRKLPLRDLNLDHVIPVSRGGENTWENMVCCDKMLNFTKANKTPKEAGLSLIRKPFKPKATPMNSLRKVITDAYRHPDWKTVLKSE